jgi:predicted MPP superfamily phosphohydrolase
MTLYAVEIYRFALYFLRRHQHQPTHRLLTSPAMIVIHILAVAGIVCFSYGYAIEPYNLEINTVRIETDKLKNTSLRIIQISDLHCDKKSRLEPRLAEFINPFNPDIIVFTGDAINSPGGLELFRGTMTSLHASIGKFAVTGNWDIQHMTNLDRFTGTGFEVLNQDVRFLKKDGEIFCIAGLGYLKGPYSGPVITKLKANCFTVFLFHTPDFVFWLKGLPVDLYLCGHTHGGQVALPFTGSLTSTVIGKKYVRGLNDYGDIPVYTNRGIGMVGWAPRIRFLSRPEITVFEIVPKNTSPERK